MVNNSLSSWGEWRVRSSIKTPTKTYDADNEVISDGHDHALLSDFDSDMIVIDTAIDKLNPVDRRILELEYKREYRDPVKQWCYEFGRATNTYKNRLSALLINSSIIIACNAC